MLPNFPITKGNILHSEAILGPNLGSLKGNTSRRTPSRVVINTCDESPKELLEKHRKVTLATKYINKIPLMMTTSR